jgi:membrane associated rhomboid family serine protease/antitoxin component YwqK of YwqJK toxin-antitoxin module
MKPRYPVTIVLIAVNVAVFALLAWQQKSLLMHTTADIFAILRAGANLNPFTLDGQPWRIVTCMFLHFGIIHLAANMYGLWSLGTMLEPGIGSARFALLYFICGLAASIASLFFNVYVVSAGASGAIFGLYGFELTAVVLSTYRDREKLIPVLINFGIFVAVNAFIAGQVSIDMSGHIGGAVAGIVIALCHFKLKTLRTWPAMAAVLIATPLLLLAVPKDQLEFYRIFKRVIAQEQFIKDLFREEKNESALHDSLLYAQEEWKNIYQAIRDLRHVPSVLTADTSTLSRYVLLKSQDLGYRIRVLDQSYIYLDSMEAMTARFDSLPNFQRIRNYDPTQPVSFEEDTTQQPPPTAQPIQVFYDKDWKEIFDRGQAEYYRVGSRDSLGRWQGLVRDYFKNGDIQMKGAYKDGIRDGVFIYYTDRHTYTSAGRIEKERWVGKWERFHWNGKPESEAFYAQRTFVQTVWDSLGNIQVSGGNGDYQSWYTNGTLKESGTFSNGERTGYWLGYRDNGKPYYKELFRNNRLVTGLSVGKDGRQFVYDALSELPVPVMGFPKYNGYVEKNLQRPPRDMAHGVVKVLFNVGADGSLWDFVILQSVSPACDAEAIRVVREGPAWRPALIHGQEKVQSQGYVEVRF